MYPRSKEVAPCNSCGTSYPRSQGCPRRFVPLRCTTRSPPARTSCPRDYLLLAPPGRKIVNFVSSRPCHSCSMNWPASFVSNGSLLDWGTQSSANTYVSSWIAIIDETSIDSLSSRSTTPLRHHHCPAFRGRAAASTAMGWRRTIFVSRQRPYGPVPGFAQAAPRLRLAPGPDGA